MPQFVRASTCFLTRDPTRVAGSGGNLSVKRHSHFQMHKGTADKHRMDVGFIQQKSLALENANADFDARLAQVGKAASGNFWIWIFNRRDDAFDSACDQRI